MKSTEILMMIVMFFSVRTIQAQEKDTLYIEGYQRKVRLIGYTSTSFIQVAEGKNHYTPNYPLSIGAGFAVKNTILSLEAGYGFIPLKSKEIYGRSKMFDFQLHNYGHKTILDVFLQNYKGFYREKKVGEVEGIYPNMAVTQIGIEATRVFNARRFSSKAAFDLNEIQKLSAGSWLLGGGAYYYGIDGLKSNHSLTGSIDFDNIQLGINGGYAYSCVMNARWMLSAMAKGGVNFGNTPKALKMGKFEIYPTAFARFATSYHKKDWGISMSVLISNKSVYPLKNNELSITTVSMQLSYVKHLDHIFSRKRE